MDQNILIILMILVMLISLVIIVFLMYRNNLRQQIYIKDLLYKTEKSTNKEMDEFKRQFSDDLLHFQSLMSNTINNDLNRLNENTTNRLSSIENKVNDGLIKGFNKANESFSNVLQQMAKIDETQQNLKSLQENINNLQSVLTDKKTRGIYGEVGLYSILENAFGNDNFYYEKQYKLSNGLIVDSIIKAPEPLGIIAIDSKFPLENYNRIYDNTLSVEENNKAKLNFKKDILKHINDIKDKYIIKGETADIAYMFIPAEAVYAEIYGRYDDIVQASYKARVYLVSPTTLMAYITAIQAIYLGQKRDDKILLIQNEFEKLSIEFVRFQERLNIIFKDFEKTYKDLNNLSLTTDKIITKFKQIEIVEINDEDEKIDAYE